MTGVTLQKVVKKYGETQVIHGVDLTVEDGEFCVFVGPSGCGKSTLLRMVAGLEETTGGAIRIGSRDVTRLDPSERGVAMVFQTYALYPHMTVEENMGFGLRMNGHPKPEIRAKVAEASRILKLDDYLKRKPAALSGGQRQRVSIGRAIVRGPEVFLFDEPLSNLDAELRVEMRVEIARLHKEIGATMIYVTHDQVEAMTLADKIVVLDGGVISQMGSPLDLYNHPANRFVASFIGSPGMNFLAATVAHAADGLQATFDGGASLRLTPRAAPHFDGTQKVEIGIRPEHVTLSDPGAGQIDGVATVFEQLGNTSYVYVDTALGQIIVETDQSVRLHPGDRLGLTLDPSRAHVFEASGKAWAEQRPQ